MNMKFLEDNSEFSRVDNKKIDFIIKKELDKNIYFGICNIDGIFRSFEKKVFTNARRGFFLKNNRLIILKESQNNIIKQFIDSFSITEQNKEENIFTILHYMYIVINKNLGIELIINNLKGFYSKQKAKDMKRFEYDLLYNNLISDNFNKFFVQETQENGLYILACNNMNNILKYLYKIKKGYNFKDVEYFIKKCRSFKEPFILKYLDVKPTKESLLKEQKEMIKTIYATNIDYIY